MARALRIPLDIRLKEIVDIPHTISFVIRKRMQADNLNELPKDKRPPIKMIWEGSPEELDDFLEKVYGTKEKLTTDIVIDDVEG